MQCNAMQCNTIQYNTIQYNTVIRYNTILYYTILYCNAFIICEDTEDPAFAFRKMSIKVNFGPWPNFASEYSLLLCAVNRRSNEKTLAETNAFGENRTWKSCLQFHSIVSCCSFFAQKRNAQSSVQRKQVPVQEASQCQHHTKIHAMLNCSSHSDILTNEAGAGKIHQSH